MHKKQFIEKTAKYKQIKEYDRYKIEAYLNIGMSKSKIAIALGFDHTAIGREIDRNGYFDGWGNFRYKANIAQEKYENRRGKAVNKQNILVNDYKMREKVKSCLELGMSPDMISGRGRKELFRTRKHEKIVSTKTIYNYIYNHSPHLKRFLLYKHLGYKKRKNVEKKIRICQNLPRIWERPIQVNSRRNRGDFEFDSIVSGGHKGGATTGIDRKTRFILVKKAKNLDGKTTTYNILEMLKGNLVRSITTDNGSEFCFLDIVCNRLHSKGYLCDPYCSRQRGSNENGNRVIRRYLPKGINIDLYSDEEINNIQNIINKKPRKILGYKTPFELFYNTELKLF